MSKRNRNRFTRPGYYWRALAFSFMYPLFGLGCLVLAAAAPWLQRRHGTAGVRAGAHRLARGWINLAHVLGILAVDWRGEPAQPGHLLVANHPTLIDVVLLLAMLPNTSCVLKADLARWPLIPGLVHRLGWVSNADPEHMLEAAAQQLREGQMLIIFPEATRTVPGQAPTLRLGAAEIAARTPCPIQPVVVRYEGSYLSKACPWYAFPAEKLHYRIDVGAPMPAPVPGPVPAPVPAASRRQQRRAIAAALQAHFDRALVAPKIDAVGSLPDVRHARPAESGAH